MATSKFSEDVFYSSTPLARRLLPPAEVFLQLKCPERIGKCDQLSAVLSSMRRVGHLKRVHDGIRAHGGQMEAVDVQCLPWSTALLQHTPHARVDWLSVTEHRLRDVGRSTELMPNPAGASLKCGLHVEAP